MLPQRMPPTVDVNPNYGHSQAFATSSILCVWPCVGRDLHLVLHASLVALAMVPRHRRLRWSLAASIHRSAPGVGFHGAIVHPQLRSTRPTQEIQALSFAWLLLLWQHPSQCRRTSRWFPTSIRACSLCLLSCPTDGRIRTDRTWATLFGTACHGISRTLSSHHCQFQTIWPSPACMINLGIASWSASNSLRSDEFMVCALQCGRIITAGTSTLLGALEGDDDQLRQLWLRAPREEPVGGLEDGSIWNYICELRELSSALLLRPGVVKVRNGGDKDPEFPGVEEHCDDSQLTSTRLCQ